MIWRCDLVPQYKAYQTEIDAAISKVLYSGQYVLAENVVAFEKEFAEYIGAGYGVGVNSGTAALMMALGMCHLQKDDEVITTSFTAIPTYSAIRHTGAKVVLVDIEPDTFLMDLNKVKDALTERTKIVVPVHLFGNAVDVEKLRNIVGPDVFIIEDCAQSHGATVRGKKTGSLGDFGVFSFYPTKNLGGYGDGGMIVTHNQEIAETMKKKRMYGMINKDEFIMDGINSRLDELQAAILRVKLKYLDAMNKRRKKLAEFYQNMLPEEYIQPQAIRRDVNSVYHVYCVRCSGQRDELLFSLENKDIQANVYYPIPLNRQKGYISAYGDTPRFPVAEDVSRRIIALPFYPEMPESIVETVANAIKMFYSQA